MSRERFEAYVMVEPPAWARGQARLLVLEHRGDVDAILRPDLTWTDVPVSQAIGVEDAGIVLPSAALPAIAEALALHLGGGHPEAATTVLREWLAAERARVDEFLRRAGS